MFTEKTMSTIWTDSGISCWDVTFSQQYAKCALLTATPNAFLPIKTMTWQQSLPVRCPLSLLFLPLTLTPTKRDPPMGTGVWGSKQEAATGSRLDWKGRPKRRTFQSTMPRASGSTSASQPPLAWRFLFWLPKLWPTFIQPCDSEFLTSPCDELITCIKMRTTRSQGDTCSAFSLCLWVLSMWEDTQSHPFPRGTPESASQCPAVR